MHRQSKPAARKTATTATQKSRTKSKSLTAKKRTSVTRRSLTTRRPKVTTTTTAPSASFISTSLTSVRQNIAQNTAPTKIQKKSYAFKAEGNFDTPIEYTFLSPRRNVSLIGVPFAFGQPLQGVDKAPQDLRKGGLLSRIQAENWSVSDHGDIPVQAHGSNEGDQHLIPDGKTPCLKSAEIVSKVCKDTALQTSTHSSKGDFMLTLGGDHSIAMGSVAGILKSRPNTGVIWVDAHADINTPLTTPSGNIHGMPVSFLMKHPHTKNLPSFEWLNDYPALNPRNIVYIGLRDLEVGERRIIKEYGIKAFTMQDVDRHGIGAVMDKAIRHLTNDRRLDIPIHLSMDIDGVDPLFAPATGTRVFGGLSYREAYFICESLAETGLLSSMDLVEVNPSLGDTPEAADRTVKIANGLIGAALGNRIL